jgi:photosystem II stability/assembly factor-like uncharacterized protein
MSFVDAQTGWAATPVMLGATIDGAENWAMLILPTGIADIAAISLIAPRQGLLLDSAGVLYATSDNSLSWRKAGQLPLGNITISTLSYPTAAMRFQGSERGMVVVSSIVEGAGQVVAFVTTDGGASWSQGVVPAPFGVPYLSRDGRFLTMLTPPYTVTVIGYNGD